MESVKADKFIKLVKLHTEFTELSASLLNEFIEKVIVHEATKKNGVRKQVVSDYKANIYEIAYLSDEQVNKFKSDFRIVADYFVQMRKNKDYKPKFDTIKYVHEILQLLSVLTKDDRFETAYNENDKGGEITICKVLGRIEDRGKTLGIEQGKALGEDRFAELSDF